jgi:hypothetical protein
MEEEYTLQVVVMRSASDPEMEALHGRPASQANSLTSRLAKELVQPTR